VKTSPSLCRRHVNAILVRRSHRPPPRALVVERLEAEGYEAFAPKTYSASRRIIPLFFGYLFVHINSFWQPVGRTPGVFGLIKFGDEPAKCSDREIDRLRAQLDERGLITLPRPPGFRAGDKVLVTKGPFQGLGGLHTGLSASQREIVLLAFLGCQRRVVVPSGYIARR
jgi:transcriptional antiterminator RfaH